MKLGFIGLGKMGYHMVRKLRAMGHEVVVYNRSPEKVQGDQPKGGCHPGRLL
ncbi:MAG: NAD(P)-binding domain-containing protein [Candidatus Marinimicrobia bacterium]|nr:NAD(P)-binding domain-containing protein [Candidatus Neomarinimicrobiota bacterium]